MASSEQQRYTKELKRIVAQFDKISPRTMKEIVAETAALRKTILSMISDESTFSTTRLPYVLSEIKRAVQQWGSNVEGDINGALEESDDLSEQSVMEFANIVAPNSLDSIIMITPEIVSVIRNSIGELVVGAETQLINNIGNEVRAVALGVQRPFDAMQAIGKLVPGIRVPIKRGSVTIGYKYIGPDARAERIVRTEVGRVFNGATRARIDRLSKKVPGVRKEWISALLPLRTRPEHSNAHGQRVDLKEPFFVGGEELMYPHDPSGSAWNVVNCLCIMAPVMDSWDAEIVPARKIL